MKNFIILIAFISSFCQAMDQKKLERAQVDNPHDNVINYNLGLVYYHNGEYRLAAHNFDRATSDRDETLSTQARFNAGNSYYKNALKELPDEWQKHSKKVGSDVLDKAIESAEKSVAAYTKLLETKPEHKEAKNNRDVAEKLLNDLRNKKRLNDLSQKQEDKEKKKEEQQNKKDEPKKQNDSSNKEQEKSDQEKQDKSEQQKNSDTSSQKQEQESNGKNQENNKKDHNTEHEVDRKGEQDAKQSSSPSEQRPEDKPKSDQSGSSQEQKMDHTNSSDNKTKEPTPTPDGKQEAAEKQENGGRYGAGEAKETLEQKRMKALLESLEHDEAATQKVLLKDKMKKSEPLMHNEKPW